MPEAGDDAVARPRDDVRGVELAIEDERELHALSGLDERDWAVLNNLRWPGRSFPNVDFVAIGPAGVFVVDTVDEPGPARIRNDRLRIDDRPQDGRVLATATAARTIAEWLPTEYRDRVHPVVCLRRRERFTGTTRGVMVCSTPSLTATLTSPEAWLEPQHVEHVSELVRRRLASSSDPRVVDEPAAPEPAEPETPKPPAPRQPPTLPRQRTASPEDTTLVERPPVEKELRQRPSRSRENRHLIWLVLAISLVMVGLVLAIENAASLRLG
jgi:hypothetical protein